MIEDKELDMKVPEDENELFLTDLKEKVEADRAAHEKALKFSNLVLDKVEEELKLYENREKLTK